MTLGEYLKEIGVKHRFFAQGLNPPVSERAMSDWVNGKAIPSLERLMEVQKLTRGKVRPEDWLTEKV